MARYTLGARMTSAPSSTLPGMSLYGSASAAVRLRELWIFNTTTTACQVALRRLTTAGTAGAALDEMEYDDSSATPTATGVNTHTVGPTITTGNLALGSLGAGIGAAVVWSFGDCGIVIPATANNGLGVLCPSGTGQICDVTWVWDE